MRKNNYNYNELILNDLDNLEIKGSLESYELRETLYSSIIMKENENAISLDAINQCKLNYKCNGQLLDESVIYNYYIDTIMQNDSLSDQEKDSE